MFITHSELMPYRVQEKDLITNNSQTEQAYEAAKNAFLVQLYRTKDPVYEIEIDLQDLTNPATERTAIIQQHMFYKQFAILLGVYNAGNTSSGFVSLSTDFGLAEQRLLLAPLEFFDKIIDTPSIFLGDIQSQVQQQTAKKNLSSLKHSLEEILYLLRTKNGLDKQRQKNILKQLLIQLGQCLPGVQSTCTLLLTDLKMPSLHEQIDIFRFDIISNFHTKCIAQRSQNLSQAHLRILNDNNIHLLNNIIKEAAKLGFIVNKEIAEYQDMFSAALPLTEEEKKGLPDFIRKQYTLEKLIDRNIQTFNTNLKQTCKELNIDITANGTMSYHDYELMKESILYKLKRYGIVDPGMDDIPVALVDFSDYFFEDLLEFEVVHTKHQRPAQIKEKHLYICGGMRKQAFFNLDGKEFRCTIPADNVHIDFAILVAKHIAKVKLVNLEQALIKNLASINACTLFIPPALQSLGLEVVAYSQHRCTISVMQNGVTYDLANSSSETRKYAAEFLDSESFLVFLAHELSRGNIVLLHDFIMHGRNKINEWAWQSLYAIVMERLRDEDQALALEILIANHVSFFMQDVAQVSDSKDFLSAYVKNYFPDFKLTISRILLSDDTPLKDQVYFLANRHPELLNLFIKEYVSPIIQPRNRECLYDIFMCLLQSTLVLKDIPQLLKDTYMSLLLMIWRHIPRENKMACIKEYAQLPISRSMFNEEFLKKILDDNQNQAVLAISSLLLEKASLPFMDVNNFEAIITECLYENKTILYYAIDYARPKHHNPRDDKRSIPALAILALGSCRLSITNSSNYPEANDSILHNPIRLALNLERIDLAEEIFKFARDPAHEFYRFYTSFHNSCNTAALRFLQNDNVSALHFMLIYSLISPHDLAHAAHAENKISFCTQHELLSATQIAAAIPPPPPRVIQAVQLPEFQRYRQGQHRQRNRSDGYTNGRKRHKRRG